VAWRSESGTENAGVVTFHKLGDGRAQVTVQIDAEPDGPVESAGEAVGLFERRVKGDLERDESGPHVHFALSVQPGQLDELVRELTAQGVEHKGPIEHEGGDRSLYFEDPEGNVVEAWDFFERGEGARDGVEALT
jgi:catechol 2,3-dioxygenase-like lactoylglutathione lyase family enzyme